MKIFIGCSASDKIAEYFIDEAKEIADALSMEGHDGCMLPLICRK